MKTCKSSLSLASSLFFATTAWASTSSGQIHVFRSDSSGFDTKTVFYDTGSEVVAFDAQFTPELARQAIAFLRTKTKSPITALVITHPNPDKFNGIPEFKAIGAKVIASRATAEAMPGVHAYKKAFFVHVAKMFTEESYPRLGTVDQTFEGSAELRLSNGETVSLRELSGPGVSSAQTVALIPAANAAVVGDLIHDRAHAWLEGGIVDGAPKPTIGSWIADLRELAGLVDPSTKIFGGRGEDVSAAEAIPAEINYLERADRIVSDYVAALGERKSELSNAQAAHHYLAIQAAFEKEFPAYQLGYLIQYGVYGLVNSKL